MTKISKAKAKLLIEKPYFGNLAAALSLHVNSDIQSFYSNGSVFEYNQEYIESLSIDELCFCLANGAMHAALAHENRQQNRISWLWQKATDYAINSMLVHNNLELPLGVNYERRFDGMYAEEIYAILQDEITHKEFEDEQSSQNMEQNLIQEERFAQLLHQSTQKADSYDELPEGIERFIELKNSSKIDWREKLHHILDRYFTDNYRVIPPSKKLLYSGIYLPSLYSEKLTLVVAIDSSGSVDEALLGTFIDELEALLISFVDVSIELLICDNKIRSHKSISSYEIREYELLGGGATSFVPVFEYIQKENLTCKLLIYFSDLDGTFPKQEPDFDTLWVSPKEAKVPFGELLVL
jgi:predicted metal-dependent peptidase